MQFAEVAVENTFTKGGHQQLAQLSSQSSASSDSSSGSDSGSVDSLSDGPGVFAQVQKRGRGSGSSSSDSWDNEDCMERAEQWKAWKEGRCNKKYGPDSRRPNPERLQQCLDKVEGKYQEKVEDCPPPDVPCDEAAQAVYDDAVVGCDEEDDPVACMADLED